MPRVVSLLGYNIGFLFQRDGIFKTGLNAFVTENRRTFCSTLVSSCPDSEMDGSKN